MKHVLFLCIDLVQINYHVQILRLEFHEVISSIGTFMARAYVISNYSFSFRQFNLKAKDEQVCFFGTFLNNSEISISVLPMIYRGTKQKRLRRAKSEIIYVCLDRIVIMELLRVRFFDDLQSTFIIQAVQKLRNSQSGGGGRRF